MSNIRIAIVGVGNCASALVQGLAYYQNWKKDFGDDPIPGISFSNIGDYYPEDIEVVAAFDIDKRKVGKPLKKAIFAEPNCARQFYGFTDKHPAGVGENVIVQRGPTLDGFPAIMKDYPEDKAFRESDKPAIDVAKVLKTRKVDILLNYCPVGSQSATEYYATSCLEAGVSFINCIPVLSINSPEWETKFIKMGLPFIGSDMRSQLGASVLSQMLQELAFDRGMEVDYHQQLNVGGNTDFLGMMMQERLKNKKVSKENVIRAQNDLRGIPVNPDALFAGPSTYIPYLKDNKVAYFNLKLRGFGNAPVEIDVKLQVCDSENSGGVVIDAIRFLKVAKEMGIMGNLRGVSNFTQKSPPKQMSFQESYHECEMLAQRKFTPSTERQTTFESAIDVMLEGEAEGHLDYLRLVEEK